MPLLPCHSGLRDVVCCEQKHIDHFPPHNNFPAQSLHFRFGSVAPCPTLKSNVTASTPRTRYGQLAKLYPTGFSCYIQSAYKSKQSFLRSLEEISYADFSARTLFTIILLPTPFRHVYFAKPSCHPARISRQPFPVAYRRFIYVYCTPVKFAAQPDCRPPASYFPEDTTVNPGNLQYNKTAETQAAPGL